MSSSYQPFPISEFKTGFYQYLEPWIRPVDAFNPLEDAYIYRGTLNKRNGYKIVGNVSAAGAGRMFYKDWLQTGSASAGPYTPTIQGAPLTAGTVTITAAAQTLTDDGLGRALQAPLTITGATQANPCQITIVGHGYTTGDQVVISSVGGMTQLNSTTPYTITVTSPDTFTLDGIDSSGYTAYTTGGTSKKVAGTINYTTGALSVTFVSSVSATTGIYATYSFTTSRPIMGLKKWINTATNAFQLMAFDTRRMCIFNTSSKLFDPVNSVSQVIYTGDGAAVTKTVLTGWVNVSPYTNALSPYSITITAVDSGGANQGTVTDDGVGGLTVNGVFAAGGSVNYATGQVVMNFTGANTYIYTMTATLAGSYFTGDQTNFFNVANWKPTTVSYAYCVNNIDRLTLYNGSTLSRPPLPTTNSSKVAYMNDISTCIDVDVFKNRLLLHRPKLVTGSLVEGQTIRYSEVSNATNFTADVAGQGGALVFPTSDYIMGGEFLRDQMIVFFKNSIWLMQPTSLSIRPFQTIQINSSRATNCPYAMVPYDQRITSVGNKGIIACDGVNTERFDINIIDQFLQIEPQAYNQCYSQRFDNNNETWMCYPSLAEADNDVNAVSDKILVYNYLENSWSIYNIAMSCLGLYEIIEDQDWAYFAVGGSEPTTWQEADWSWWAYVTQKGFPSLLGGGHNGTVYQLDTTEQDNSTDFSCNITSAFWNPFVKQGVAVDFGYIDIYYTVNENVTLTLTFMVNGASYPSATRQITLSASPASDDTQITNFQRVYLNFRAQFVQMKIVQDNTTVTGQFTIQGMVLWAKPSGRLQPGSTLI